MVRFRKKNIRSSGNLYYKQQPKYKSTGKKNNFWKFIVKLFLLICIFFLIRNYVFFISIVKQNSMNDTLHDGDILLVSCINPTKVKRGDIVIIKNPISNSKHEYLVKRIIAYEGDYIEIWENILLLNDEILEEKYITYTKNTSNKYSGFQMLVPENHIFVMGDNRDFSNDSRNFGSIPIKNVVAKIYIRIHPFERFGFVN